MSEVKVSGELFGCVVLAFLQNQWVRRPEQVKAMIARHGEHFRLRFIRFALFRGCLTGRRLQQAFGAACDSIIWEETTREIGGTSHSWFPPDLDHMIDTIRTYRPTVVLSFGSSTWEALFRIQDEKSHCLDRCAIIRAPHPASRQADIMANLQLAAERMWKAVEQAPPPGPSGEGKESK